MLTRFYQIPLYITPGMDSREAMSFSEAARTGINGLQRVNPASRVAGHVTVTIGGYSCPAGKAMTAEEILHRTTLALVEGQAQGHNRVMCTV